MHILIAPNAFKNSLSADEAAEAIGEGLKRSNLACTCSYFPIADGGDGTGSLIRKKMGGKSIATEVSDPLGRPVSAPFTLLENGTAVIEMADASGIRLLSSTEADPLRASSFGTGQLIKAALDKGAKKITLALGGSATVDGGTGILQALGVRFFNADVGELFEMPSILSDLEHIDLSGLDTRLSACEISVLCDVENALLGEYGAAAVFGPQKGASHEDIIVLETGLSRLSSAILNATGKDVSLFKGGGAAGGAAAGLYGVLDVSLTKGIEAFLDTTGFDRALSGADLLITGEGSIDEQTLQGKGPMGVAARAKRRNIPVIGLAGKIPVEAHDGLSRYFDALIAIGNEPAGMEESIANAGRNLVRSAYNLGNLLALGKQY